MFEENIYDVEKLKLLKMSRAGKKTYFPIEDINPLDYTLKQMRIISRERKHNPTANLDPKKYDDLQMESVFKSKRFDYLDDISDLDPKMYDSFEMSLYSHIRGSDDSYVDISDLDKEKYSIDFLSLISQDRSNKEHPDSPYRNFYNIENLDPEKYSMDQILAIKDARYLTYRFSEEYGNIDDLDPKMYDEEQMHIISKSRGTDNSEFGNIDDLDPKMYDEDQMEYVSLGRGDSGDFPNMDDISPEIYSSEVFEYIFKGRSEDNSEYGNIDDALKPEFEESDLYYLSISRSEDDKRGEISIEESIKLNSSQLYVLMSSRGTDKNYASLNGLTDLEKYSDEKLRTIAFRRAVKNVPIEIHKSLNPKDSKRVLEEKIDYFKDKIDKKIYKDQKLVKDKLYPFVLIPMRFYNLYGNINSFETFPYEEKSSFRDNITREVNFFKAEYYDSDSLLFLNNEIGSKINEGFIKLINNLKKEFNLNNYLNIFHEPEAKAKFDKYIEEIIPFSLNTDDPDLSDMFRSMFKYSINKRESIQLPEISDLIDMEKANEFIWSLSSFETYQGYNGWEEGNFKKTLSPYKLNYDKFKSCFEKDFDESIIRENFAKFPDSHTKHHEFIGCTTKFYNVISSDERLLNSFLKVSGHDIEVKIDNEKKIKPLTL